MQESIFIWVLALKNRSVPVFYLHFISQKRVILLKELLQLLIMIAHPISFRPGKNPGKSHQNEFSELSIVFFFCGSCSTLSISGTMMT